MKHDHKQSNIVQLGRKPAAETEPEAHVDPVCKMFVTPETAAAKYEFNATTYYFCNPGCKTKFAADPEKYLSTTAAQSHGETERDHSKHSKTEITDRESEIEYTCPMHPEIVQIGPGSCPICGMAL